MGLLLVNKQNQCAATIQHINASLISKGHLRNTVTLWPDVFICLHYEGYTPQTSNYMQRVEEFLGPKSHYVLTNELVSDIVLAINSIISEYDVKIS